jgi:hypothetical protein
MIRAVESGGDWRMDIRTVRSLVCILELEDADPGRPMPERREDLVRVLMTARERLRRQLLLAEGVDPRTGRTGA